ncbi:hypothetical protein Ciccas_011952, partial [Cichlidogyrus casuarinus]
HNPKEEPINVLNICLLAASWEGSNGEEESTLSNDDVNVNQLESFVRSHADEMRRMGIRRITFLISKPRSFPNFYTFRASLGFNEDLVYRNLEPALAFQLEINRMSNYDLEQIAVYNRRMHLYLGRAKALPKQYLLANVTRGHEIFDYRFFVRTIIRHADFVSKAASFDFLQSEAERVLLESMDAMEVASTHKDAHKTTGNHIFMNFASTMVLEDIDKLKDTVKNVVLRYGPRLWRLRITQAELKVTLSHSDKKIPVRLFLKGEQGYDLDMDVYREAPDFNTGQVQYVSLDTRLGPLHGKVLGMPYETKDYIQLKRFNAQKFNTTFVYDYPKLIDQALMDYWKSCFPNTILQPKRSSTTSLKLNQSDEAVEKLQRRTRSFVGPTDKRGSVLSSLLEEFSPETNFEEEEEEETENLVEKNKFGDFVLECLELALDKEGRLRPVDRLIGTNEIGMVVWYMVLKTPEYPQGRPVVVIANDVTIKAGSFGPAEDLVFARASQLARRLGIPRVYLAANTGARIRLADEVKPYFKVEWYDENRPEKGFRYLYLTPEGYEILRQQNSVICEKIMVGDEERYRIDTILGRDHDMSVENLRGSAMIAGETSTAYEDCYTISVCTSRTIGIGAYLVRLGQRLVQVDNSHIILTGAMALNKLLGREVYSSNSQLGGIQILASNGVTHFVVPDEFYALKCVMQSLTYVPIRRGYRKLVFLMPISLDQASSKPLKLPEKPIETEDPAYQLEPPPSFTWDVIDRPVTFVPTRERPMDDPRWMLTGVYESQLTGEVVDKSKNKWLSGFFDCGTFQESLAAWAQGVIVGRARLGGIACGVIVTETRSTIAQIPADPANPESEAVNINQAGQVWYPDSAYKTAQAIADFSREELPIFIFANWRGFSGGLKDMFDQVLKFGAMIVDSLRRYPNPVYVYLPPHAELRGGAWVVVDPAINPDMMEMYADPVGARASVLEPDGTIEIKYRRPELIKLMNRLDPICTQLQTKLTELGKQMKNNNNLVSTSPTRDEGNRTRDPSMRRNLDAQVQSIKVELEQRQKYLLPIYQQVARNFADLHDTPKRLMTRNLIDGLVSWTDSRRVFYGKLRRRLLELDA